MENASEGRLLVLNCAGLPVGTLERVDVGESVLKSLGLNLPESLLKAARKQNLYPLGIGLPQVVETMLAAGLVNNQDRQSL